MACRQACPCCSNASLDQKPTGLRHPPTTTVSASQGAARDHTDGSEQNTNDCHCTKTGWRLVAKPGLDRSCLQLLGPTPSTQGMARNIYGPKPCYAKRASCGSPAVRTGALHSVSSASSWLRPDRGKLCAKHSGPDGQGTTLGSSKVFTVVETEASSMRVGLRQGSRFRVLLYLSHALRAFLPVHNH